MKKWDTNTVIITGTVFIDCRSRWQRFKDFFKPRTLLAFDNKEKIIHKASELVIPTDNKLEP